MDSINSAIDIFVIFNIQKWKDNRNSKPNKANNVCILGSRLMFSLTIRNNIFRSKLRKGKLHRFKTDNDTISSNRKWVKSEKKDRALLCSVTHHYLVHCIRKFLTSSDYSFTLQFIIPYVISCMM